MLKDLANTLVRLGRALEVLLSTNLLADILSLVDLLAISVAQRDIGWLSLPARE